MFGEIKLYNSASLGGIMITFWRNWNRNKGAGYERKCASTSIGFAVMSNTCWHLVNQFTNSRYRLRQMWPRSQLHV